MQTKRICSCGAYIPYSVKIDGKWRNLASRKFCLTCSPFGSHNTRKDLSKTAMRPMVNGRRASYADWSEDAKDDNRARIFWRGKARKQALIELKGGGCSICKYNKCERALTFHHRDSKQKSFTLDSRNLQMFPWHEVLSEADKCDLVCFNCHMELEHTGVEYKYERFRERYCVHPDSNRDQQF